MNTDQKIMDMFANQSLEILFLKASNRVLNSEIENLKAKLKTACEKLRHVSRHLNDGYIVDEALSKIEGKNEKE